jgi:hypothetical protein
MPLTTAHAAAAWPIRRVWPALPLVPLVTGTLSPDFEYLYLLAPTARSFHSPQGIVFFCLPVSLIVVAVFDRLIRPSVARRLPPGLADRISRGRTTIGAAAVAIVLGAATHVFWDGFTHAGDWGVRALPILREGGLHIAGRAIAWYKLLQHASTAGGSIAIGVWAWRAWRALPAALRTEAMRQSGAIVRAALFVGAIAATGAVLNGAVAWDRAWSFVLGRAAVGAMDGVVIGALVVAWRDHKEGRASARPPRAG